MLERTGIGSETLSAPSHTGKEVSARPDQRQPARVKHGNQEGGHAVHALPAAVPFFLALAHSPSQPTLHTLTLLTANTQKWAFVRVCVRVRVCVCLNA